MQEVKTDIVSLLAEVQKSFDTLFEVTSQLTDDILNRPSQNGWTIGQILEHVLKSQVGMIRVLRGHSVPVTRNPNEKVAYFVNLFGDDTVKLPSGGGVIPDDSPKDLERMLAKFHSNKLAIVFQVKERDMNQEYTGFTHPKFGNLTGVEWVYFEQSHTGRHLRKILKLI